MRSWSSQHSEKIAHKIYIEANAWDFAARKLSAFGSFLEVLDKEMNAEYWLTRGRSLVKTRSLVLLGLQNH